MQPALQMLLLPMKHFIPSFFEPVQRISCFRKTNFIILIILIALFIISRNNFIAFLFFIVLSSVSFVAGEFDFVTYLIARIDEVGNIFFLSFLSHENLILTKFIRDFVDS